MIQRELISMLKGSNNHDTECWNKNDIYSLTIRSSWSRRVFYIFSHFTWTFLRGLADFKYFFVCQKRSTIFQSIAERGGCGSAYTGWGLNNPPPKKKKRGKLWFFRRGFAPNMGGISLQDFALIERNISTKCALNI